MASVLDFLDGVVKAGGSYATAKLQADTQVKTETIRAPREVDVNAAKPANQLSGVTLGSTSLIIGGVSIVLLVVALVMLRKSRG